MRAERIQIGNDIAAYLTASDYLYFVTSKGLKASDFTALRGKLAAAGAECHIFKNRILRKVAELNGMETLAAHRLTGDTAVILGKGDAGPVAKIIDAYAKETKGLLTAKGGYLEGAILSGKEVMALAQLPSKDALRAQVLGLLVAVPSGLVRVLNAKIGSLVNVLDAYRNKLAEEH